MMFIMMLVGLGMVLGNLFSGRISGRYSPLRIAAMTNGVIVAALLLIFAFWHTAAGFADAGVYLLRRAFSRSPRRCKILLLQNARGGEMLGAAGGQIAFNLGSAIGAYCGGMMITFGAGWRSVALPAAALSFPGDELVAAVCAIPAAGNASSRYPCRAGLINPATVRQGLASGG